MNKLIAPLKGFGSKWALAPEIIKYFPEHENYIEPFARTAAVLIQKRPSLLEVYNDLDSAVVNFFRVLRDRGHELREKIKLTPYAREEFQVNRLNEGDELERARRFFCSSWMSISNLPFEGTTGWRSDSYHGQGFVDTVPLFRQAEEVLELIQRRFRYVTIENRPASYVIDRYDNINSVLYCDPPYIHSTRTSGGKYGIEMTNAEHIELAAQLRQVRGYVVLSGYRSKLYEQEYEAYGWQRIEFNRLTNTQQRRIECLWLNPHLQRSNGIQLGMF